MSLDPAAGLARQPREGDFARLHGRCRSHRPRGDGNKHSPRPLYPSTNGQLYQIDTNHQTPTDHTSQVAPGRVGEGKVTHTSGPKASPLTHFAVGCLSRRRCLSERRRERLPPASPTLSRRSGRVGRGAD